MLSDVQLDELRLRGTTRVAEMIDAEAAGAIEDDIWRYLDGRCGAVPDDPSTWPDEIGKLQALRRERVFDAFRNDRLAAICEQLLGPGWVGDLTHPQALMSFPGPGPWELPHGVWHFDLPARGSTQRLGALRLIGFVNEVEPRGGGTLVVEGSHTLVERLVAETGGDAGQSKDARRALRSNHPWFATLNERGDPEARIRRLMDEGDEIDGVAVRVAELTGSPGDAFVMHPWVLHNIAPNRGGRPRMMFTHTIYAAGSPFLVPRG